MANLLALPSEIHLLILQHCYTLDRLRLRLTNRHFYTLIAPPERWELQNMEWLSHGRPKEQRLMTCGGCIRLRPMSKFARNHLFYCTSVPDQKFCLECGRRELRGRFRYQEGDVWAECEGSFVRCKGCKQIGRLHAGAESKTCEDCGWS